jgi:conjugal transfer mating pair stabilization protein TraN
MRLKYLVIDMPIRFFIKVLLKVLLLLSSKISFADMTQSYQEGKALGQQISTLPPAPKDEFLQTDKDTSRLVHQNETSLSEGGAIALQENDMEQLLSQSEMAKIQSNIQHDINDQNGLIKGSMAIELDPFSKTGGNQMQQKSTQTRQSNESCLEGVDFEVDVTRQLTFVPPPWSSRTIYSKHKVNFLDYMRRMKLRLADYCKRFTEPNEGSPPDNKWWNNVPNFAGAFSASNFKIYCGLATHLGLKCANITSASVIRDWDYWWYLYAPWAPHNMWHKDWSWIPTWVEVEVGVQEWYRDSSLARESWSVLNPLLEQISEENSCHESKRACLDSGTKVIDGYSVTKPCWQEKITYACTSEPENGCKWLKDKGCQQTTSTCEKQAIGICMQWRKNFTCFTKEENISTSFSEGEMFCQSGNCFSPTIEQNNDMHEAVSKLAILQEVQKQMAGNPPKVFKGDERVCSKHMLSFVNCCTSMKGWGKSLGMTSCSENEKALAMLRGKGVCHYVGSHCAERVFGACVQRKSNYCCFASKLARIFHEQGRPQIGKNFGSSEYPNCEAFSVEELAKLDFSKMDLSEVFDEIFKNADGAIKKAMPSQIQGQMPIMQKELDSTKNNNRQNWNNDNVTKKTF